MDPTCRLAILEEMAERNSMGYFETFLGPKLDSHLCEMVDSGKAGKGWTAKPISSILKSGRGSESSESDLRISASSLGSETSWFRMPWKRRKKHKRHAG